MVLIIAISSIITNRKSIQNLMIMVIIKSLNFGIINFPPSKLWLSEIHTCQISQILVKSIKIFWNNEQFNLDLQGSQT